MPARVLAAGTRLGAAASSSPASVLASHRRAAGCPLRCSAPAAPSEPAELALRVAGSRRVLCGRTAEPCRPHVPSSSAEFRAAAAVRASAFYTYPKDRSAFAASSHQRMKMDAEWAAIEAKTSGKDVAFKAVSVSCLVGVLPLPEDPEALLALCAGLDASCRLPAAAQSPPCVVVGTLDLNRGATLPAEELGGVAGDSHERAYISNVAVAAGARRRGVARSLLRFAAQSARRAGVRHLYVHVVADNEAARCLYLGNGFEVESQETTAEAGYRGHPRRLLLVQRLQ